MGIETSDNMISQFRGPQGTQGERGDNGKDGRDGIDGKNGIDGRMGVDGKDGLPGSNGTDGQPGADGKDGKDGVNGCNGKDGKDGRDGADGKDGLAGKDGVNGLDGLAGKAGRDGKDGTPGLDGHDGKDGKDAPFSSWVAIHEGVGVTNAQDSTAILLCKELELGSLAGFDVKVLGKGPSSRFYGVKHGLVFIGANGAYRTDADVIEFNPRRSNPALNFEVQLSGNSIAVVVMGSKEEEINWKAEVKLAVL